jgi:hypothetical protein
MRYYLIQPAEDGIPAHVVGEFPDFWLAADVWGGDEPIVSRAEAFRDPEQRAALEAWDAQDDSAYDLTTEAAKERGYHTAVADEVRHGNTPPTREEWNAMWAEPHPRQQEVSA